MSVAAMWWRYLAHAGLFAALLAGCGNDNAGQPELSAADLLGHSFASMEVTEGGESRPLVGDTFIVVVFAREDEDVVRFRAGCNTFGAGVEITDDRLLVGRIVGTEMRCPADLARQEKWVSDFFGSDPNTELSRDVLTLTSGETVVEMEEGRRVTGTPEAQLEDATSGQARSAAKALAAAGSLSAAAVQNVRPGRGPLVDLIVETELPMNDSLGAKEICTTVKDQVPGVDSVRVKGQGGEIFAAACLGPPRRTSEPPRQPIVVARVGDGFPPTCGPRSVGKRLRGLSRALREADAEALRRYWGRGFEGLSVGYGSTDTGFSAPTYAQGLYALTALGGLRLSFKEVELTSRSGEVAYRGTLWVKGSEKKRLVGKAKLSCQQPSVIRLAAFTSRRVTVAHCQTSGRHAPGNAMIVCT